MSNDKRKYVFSVEGEDAITEGYGTGFYVEDGHLVIEDNGDRVAAFAPGRWIEVTRRRPELSELAEELGREASRVAEDLFEQLGINTKEN